MGIDLRNFGFARQIMDGAPVRGGVGAGALGPPVLNFEANRTFLIFNSIRDRKRGLLKKPSICRQIMDGAPVGGESVPAPWFNFEAD